MGAVLIRMTDKAKTAAVMNNHFTVSESEWVYTFHDAQLTPEQMTTAIALGINNQGYVSGSSIVLGEFVPSMLTDEPRIRPFRYDEMPMPDDIWNQLAVMAGQYDQAKAESGFSQFNPELKRS